MKIILSESLPQHFDEFAMQEMPSVDRILQWEWQWRQRTAEWHRLRCAAKLVADESIMHLPVSQYRDLAKQRGFSDGMFWLQNELKNCPTLLVDGEKRRSLFEPWFSQRMRSDSGSDRMEAALVAMEAFTDLLTSPMKKSQDTLFLSPDPHFNRAILEMNPPMKAESILALLATAGISIFLPSIEVKTGDVMDINYVAEDEILDELRTRYAAEREEFVLSLREFIKECHEGLKNELYDDVLDYADKATNQKLLMQVRRFEKAVAKGDAKLLERIRVGMVEGIPAVFEAALDPKKSAIKQGSVELLKVLCKSIAQKSAYREACEKFPMASYAYQLKKGLET